MAMGAKITVEHEPDIAVENGNVYCNGKVVGRVLTSEAKGSAVQVDVRIDDEEVFRAIRDGIDRELA